MNAATSVCSSYKNSHTYYINIHIHIVHTKTVTSTHINKVICMYVLQSKQVKKALTPEYEDAAVRPMGPNGHSGISPTFVNKCIDSMIISAKTSLEREKYSQQP